MYLNYIPFIHVHIQAGHNILMNGKLALVRTDIRVDGWEVVSRGFPVSPLIWSFVIIAWLLGTSPVFNIILSHLVTHRRLFALYPRCLTFIPIELNYSALKVKVYLENINWKMTNVNYICDSSCYNCLY